MRRVIITILGVVALVGLIVFLALPRSGANWRQISSTFAGITNSPAGRFAMISIINDGNMAVILRDSFELEYVGIQPHSPVAGLTNLVRLTPTGTNLVIDASRRADFLIPIPSDGYTWIARLEFAPAGLRTKVGEHLIRRQEQWATSLPSSIRGVPIHVVSQCFTTKELPTSPSRRTSAPPLSSDP